MMDSFSSGCVFGFSSRLSISSMPGKLSCSISSDGIDCGGFSVSMRYSFLMPDGIVRIIPVMLYPVVFAPRNASDIMAIHFNASHSLMKAPPFHQLIQ